MIKDKFSGRPRGFAFVTMETKEAADAAVQALNGKEIDGRALTVNEARPREERAPRSGGGGGYGGGGGGGGRGGRREYAQVQIFSVLRNAHSSRRRSREGSLRLIV